VISAGALVGDVDQIAGMSPDGHRLIPDGDLALTLGAGDVQKRLRHQNMRYGTGSN
jgi:hypothetical protein